MKNNRIQSRWVLALCFLFILACASKENANNPGQSVDAKAMSGVGLLNAAFQTQDSTQRKTLLQQAAVQLKKEIDLHPTIIDPYLNYGACAYDLRLYAESVEAYRSAFHISPDNEKVKDGLTYALQGYGSYLAGKTDVEGGISILEEAWDIKPATAIAANLANYYHAMGNHQKVIQWYQKAIASSPNDAQLNYRLAQAYHEYGNSTAAKEAYEKAKQLDPNVGPL